MKNIFLFFLIFILFIVCVNAEYPYVNYNDFDGGAFSPEMISGEWDALPVTTVTPYNTPVIADLDSDGIEEIVAFRNNQIAVYYYNTTIRQLYTLSSISAGCTLSFIPSNLVIADLDDDNFKEIVLFCDVGGNKQVNIYEYSSGVLSLDSNIAGFDSDLRLYPMIQCDDDRNICVVVGGGEGVSTQEVKSQAFDFSTKGSAFINHASGAGGNNYWCTPYGSSIFLANFDQQDGDKEFVFSSGVSSMLAHYVFAINVTDALVITEELDFSTEASVGSVGCWFEDNTYPDSRKTYSPISVGDYDPTVGLEIVVGVMTSADNYKLFIYDSAGNELGSFPTLARHGEFMSNVFPANIIYDTGMDACVFTYDESENEIDLMCINDQSPNFASEIFSYDITDMFNMADDNERNHMHIMTVDVSSNEVEGNNLDEIVTPYGVFRVLYNGLFGILDNDLDLMFDFGLNESHGVIANDFDGTGYSDVLIYTEERMIYIDDTFVNSPASVRQWNFSPCSVIQINSSMVVEFVVEDIDDDIVYANATIYYDHSNEQNAPTLSGVSGTKFRFTFVEGANVTGFHTLAMRGWDEENNDTVHTWTEFFTVDTIGNSLYQCWSSGTADPQDGSGYDDVYDDVNETVTDPIPGNVFDDTVNTFTGITGLGSTIFWLIVMIGLGFAIVYGLKGQDGQIIMISLGLLETVLLVIGVKLGYISAGILWTLIILAVLIVGSMIGKKFFHTQGG